MDPIGVGRSNVLVGDERIELNVNRLRVLPIQDVSQSVFCPQPAVSLNRMI